MVKKGAIGFFSDHKSRSTRDWTLWPPVYTFYSRSFTSTYKFCLAQVDDLFSSWSVSIWRHRNWTHGSRFVIREKSHYVMGFFNWSPETRNLCRFLVIYMWSIHKFPQDETHDTCICWNSQLVVSFHRWLVCHWVCRVINPSTYWD